MFRLLHVFAYYPGIDWLYLRGPLSYKVISKDPNLVIQDQDRDKLSRFAKSLPSLLLTKDAGFVYESLRIETNQVI